VSSTDRLPSAIATLTPRIPAVAVGVGFLAALWPFARLDFDRNHDGYMLTVAIAHHAGLDLHREVASQYGPLTTWTQELFLHLPIAPAFALRIWTILLLAATAAIIADLGRIAPSSWRLNLWTSSGAALVWVLICDLWLGFTLHPWSSVLAAFLTAAAMHCWVHAESRADLGQHVFARRLFTAAGIAVGLSPFARINVGITAIVGTLVVAILTDRLQTAADSSSPKRPRALRSYTLGLCIGIVLPLARLGWTRSISAYVEQSILTPLEWSDRSNLEPRAYLAGTFQEYVPLVLIVILSIAVSSRVSDRSSLATRTGVPTVRAIGLLGPPVFAGFAGLATLRWFAMSVTSESSDVDLLQTLANWRWGSFTSFFIDVALVSTALTAASLAAFWLRDLLMRVRLNREFVALTFAGVLGVSGLTQIYPGHDSRHIWWGLPLGLLLVAWGLRTTARPAATYGPLVIIIALLGVTAVSGYVTSLKAERFSHPSTISSAGFKSSIDIAGAQIEDVKLLERTIGHTISAIFYVYDNDLTSLFGHRPNAAPNILHGNVFTRSTLTEKLSSRPPLVVDHWDPDLRSLAPVEDFIHGTDYFLSSRSTSRVVLLAPPCVNGSCAGVDPNEVCMAWGSCRPRSFRTEGPDEIELPAGIYLDADTVIPIGVFDEGFSSDQRSGRWFVDRLAGNPVLVEWPAKVSVGERWITGQRAVLRFTSGESATPTRMDLVFRTSPSREVEVHVLTTAQKKSVTVGGKDTKVQVLLDANSVQEVVIRCESFETSFAPAPDLPVCAELIGMTLSE
jgi:hypothetical protein